MAVKIGVMSTNQTEICELPKNWQCVRLGEHIYKPEYGYTTRATKERKGLKILRISDIQNEQVDWELVPYCECNDLVRQKYLLKPGDILVARIGATTGKTFLAQDRVEAIFASYLIRIRTKSDLLPRFLNYFFQSQTYWDQINQHKADRLKGGISVPILTHLNIPLPPLPEQEAIAKILQVVDGAKKARLREIEMERERKLALMEHLCTHGTKNEATKYTDIGDIPQSWKVKPLAEIVLDKEGLKRGPWGGSIKKDIFVAAGYKVYEQRNVISNDFAIGNYFVDRTKFEELKEFRVQEGDILLTAAGTMGKLAIVLKNSPDGIINQALIRIRLNQDLISNSFFKSIFELYVSHGLLARYSHGAALKNLSSTSVLKSIPIALPSIKEQYEIQRVSSGCDQKITALEHEQRLLQELFRTVLEKLFTARLSSKQLIRVEQHE